MSRKLQRFTVFMLVVGLASLLTIGSLYRSVNAQEVTGLLTDMGEGDSRALTTSWLELGPGEQHTYSFAHDGGEQPITVWMNVVPADGAILQIWTEETLAQAAENPETEPVGQGTAMTEQAGLLSWQGTSPDAETYYLIVSSTSEAIARYVLTVSSADLAADQPGPAAPEAPIEPETPPTPDPNIAVVTTNALNVRAGPSTAYPVIVTVPNGTALAVLGRNAINTWISVQLEDGTQGWVTRSLTDYITVNPNVLTADPLPSPTPQPGITPVPGENVQTSDADAEEALGDDWQILPEGESRWYTFQHQGGEEPVHIWMDIEPNEGAGFRVLSEENARSIMAGSNPEDVEDIGRGTPNPLEPGYLFWRGNFEEAGTFYVLVEHAWQGDIFYSIHAAGPGLGRPVPE